MDGLRNILVVSSFFAASLAIAEPGKGAGHEAHHGAEKGHTCKNDKGHKEGKCAKEKGATAESQLAPSEFATKPAVGTKARCAVTGEEFAVEATTKIVEHKGKFYTFCCPGCKDKFEASPEKYINQK